MKLLFIADGRSPTAINWISYFVAQGQEVHLLSSFPCEPLAGLASFDVIPLAFSQAQGEGLPAGGSSLLRKVIPVGLRTRLRQWLGPLTLPKAAASLRMVIDRVQPDLVHALRIPYEGMLAALAFEGESQTQRFKEKIPLVVSVWGNDFTLHARSTPRMADYTRLVLHHVDGLHTDCQRDQRLAQEWGFDPHKAKIVLPGGGGIRMEVFHPSDASIANRPPVVINPRGFRAYVRNDTFFQAIPKVLANLPEARFICPAMQGEVMAEKWIKEFKLSRSVDLLPRQTRQQMAELYRQAQVVVSITTHDGTPNTLLEALSCGCFPIAGDLESLREWIDPGENGLLVEAGNPQALADAILKAMHDAAWRSRAAVHNHQLVSQRAEYGRVMGLAEDFYRKLIKNEVR